MTGRSLGSLNELDQENEAPIKRAMDLVLPAAVPSWPPVLHPSPVSLSRPPLPTFLSSPPVPLLLLFSSCLDDPLPLLDSATI